MVEPSNPPVVSKSCVALLRDEFPAIGRWKFLLIVLGVFALLFRLGDVPSAKDFLAVIVLLWLLDLPRRIYRRFRSGQSLDAPGHSTLLGQFTIKMFAVFLGSVLFLCFAVPKWVVIDGFTRRSLDGTGGVPAGYSLLRNADVAFRAVTFEWGNQSKFGFLADVPEPPSDGINFFGRVGSKAAEGQFGAGICGALAGLFFGAYGFLFFGIADWVGRRFGRRDAMGTA